MTLKEHRKANEQEKKRQKKRNLQVKSAKAKLTFSNLCVHFRLTGLATIIREYHPQGRLVLFLFCVLMMRVQLSCHPELIYTSREVLKGLLRCICSACAYPPLQTFPESSQMSYDKGKVRVRMRGCFLGRVCVD